MSEAAAPKGVFASNRGFLPWLCGRVAAVLGRQIFFVAVGFDIYERTHSTFALGLVGLVQVVPVVLLAIPAGNAVDRFDARRVALLSTLGMFVCALGFTLFGESAHLGVFYALLFLHATAVAFHSPAVGTLLPRLIDPATRTAANAWSSTAFELASVVGPALSGLLLAAGSARHAYAVHTGGSLVLAGVLLWILRADLARPVAAVAKRAQSLRDLTAGLRFIFKSKLLLPAITLDLFAVLLGGVTALLPVFALDVLHVGPQGLGFLRAAPAVGALVMALLTTRLPPWKRPGVVLLIVVAIFGVATLGFAVSKSLLLSLVLLAIAGAADNISVVIRITLEQSVVPDQLRGRVSAVHYVFIGLSNELGEFESGVTASLLGPVGSVVLGGFGTLAVVGLIAWRFPELVGLKPLAELEPELHAAA
ncbi:MAG: MFS transporter [Deltaproteobacteria bacterium]|nr:MFS transporter [Deltaproteobacteria bacterium]